MGFTGFYWFLPGFLGFTESSSGFSQDVLPSFTEFYWVSLGSTRFYRGLSDFHLIFPSFTGVNYVLPNFTGFLRILLSIGGFYQVFTGFC